MQDRLLVVVAHPDDETFGCGSLLAHAAGLGVPTTVACATRGEEGSPAPGRGLDDADMAVWRAERVYLHCLPQELMKKWVDALVEQQPDSQHLGLGDLGTPPEQITTVIDTSDVLERREEAIRLHRSQTSPYEVMPAELRREFLTAERLRRIRPPWDGGPIETQVFTRSSTE